MVAEIYLSICIPTYNRAPYLRRCLQSIVNQVGNNPEVEVVISDNLSDDDTPVIVATFAEEFKNVKYFRNEVNIGGDKNFIRVLKLGKGKYLKLLNDYVEFKDGGVLKMLEIIKSHSESKEILFFINGVSYLKRKEYYYSRDLNDFLKICSFWSTLIGAIGFWKEDFNTMLATYQFKTTSFRQTELLFENFNLNKGAVTYARQISNSIEVVNKKAGYNFFDVFINGYFNQIIGRLRTERRISYRTYLREKNKFFKDFIFVWYKRIRIKKNHSVQIDDRRMEAIIFENYKYNYIFYLYLFYLPFYLAGFYFKKMVRHLKKAA